MTSYFFHLQVPIRPSGALPETKWLGAIPKVRCGICAVSTLRMCFYACRISLISGLSNEDLICWGDS